MSENSTTNFNVTKPLRDFFNYNYIDRLKYSFLEELERSGMYDFIDYDNLIGSFHDYDDFGNYIINKFTFEDYLKNKKSSLYEDIEKSILEFYYENQLKELEIDNFKKKINRDINFLLKTQYLLFQKYQFLKSFLNDFIYILYNINLFKYKGYPFPFNPDYISPFQFKANWANREDIKEKFNKYRTLLNKKGIIHSEDISEDDFYNVFSGGETNKSIRFKCESPIAVKILLSISHIYINFSAVEIENSKRFFTRTNKILTRSNYGTQLHRFSRKGTTESENQLFSEINKIFPKKNIHSHQPDM